MCELDPVLDLEDTVVEPRNTDVWDTCGMEGGLRFRELR
jgi:hypothetical protein